MENENLWGTAGRQTCARAYLQTEAHTQRRRQAEAKPTRHTLGLAAARPIRKPGGSEVGIAERWPLTRAAVRYMPDMRSIIPHGTLIPLGTALIAGLANDSVEREDGSPMYACIISIR
jgi:hypothetical protein